MASGIVASNIEDLPPSAVQPVEVSPVLMYYVVGLAGMRTTDASIAPNVTACAFFAIVVIELLTPRARDASSALQAVVEDRG
jgi:hypothetical protein